MSEELGKLIERLYNFFYSKFYNKPNFKLDLEKNRGSRQIENFISLLARHYQIDSININFLINYFGWSFSRRFGQITKRDISLNWIIGKKTFAKFLEKKEEEAYYTDQFVAKIGVNLDQLKQEFHEDEVIEKGLDPAEEFEKQRHKGDGQLFHCLQFTTLYNNRSSICIMCSHKSVCKRSLKIKFPNIFNNRGYR